MADDEKPKKFHYTEIEALEAQGKKYTGNQREHWVDNKSICTSCRWAHITRRKSRNIRQIYCNSISKFIPEDISECNEYQKFTELSLEQMAGIAVRIDPRPDGYKGYL